MADKKNAIYNENILFNERDNYIYEQIIEKINYFYKLEDISDLIKYSNYSTFKKNNFIFNMIELISIKYKYIKDNFINYKKNLISLEKQIYKNGKESLIDKNKNKDENGDKNEQEKEIKQYSIDKEKSSVFKGLKKIISNHFDKNYKDKYDIYPFGSSTQFLGNKNSDIDIYLDLRKLSSYEKENFIESLQKIFKLKKPLVISKRICCLTIEYEEIEIDLSLLGLPPYIHSLLFREYSLMDPRFPLVAISLKKFIKNLGLAKNENYINKYLNSFCWISLLIAFLQDIIDPPILPKVFSYNNNSIINSNIEYGNFYKSKNIKYNNKYSKLRQFINNIKNENVELPSCLFNPDELKKIYYEQIGKNKNKMSCAEILLKFLEFIIYYFKFDILFVNFSMEKEGFENNNKLKNDNSEFGKYYNKYYKKDGTILIRDPIDSHYNPAQSLKIENFEIFIENLKNGYKSLLQNGNLNCLLNEK